MAGFKDIRTCEVCGEEEQRVSYKRIILAAIGGVGIVGAAGIALLIGRNAKSADGYLETKRQQEIQALETVETTESIRSTDKRRGDKATTGITGNQYIRQ